MKFLKLQSHNPYLNLAIEEYLFKNETEDIFMLWQNEPTIVIGKNQNVYAEINREYVENNGINVARRITGGGAVYHDLGNINYSFIATRQGNGDIDFAYFTAPIIEALHSLGINAALSGRNDIEAFGKKLSGNAQHREGNRILHHGTLLFDTDLNILSKALTVDVEKIKSKAIKSTRARVGNIKDLLNTNITSETFIKQITEFIIKKYSPEIINIEISDEIEKLRKKYESRDFVYPNTKLVSTYTTVKKQRYDFGTVCIMMEMSNDIILDIKIYGDFFGIKSISELENLIKGKSLVSLEEYLANINIEEYILGANSEFIMRQIRL